MIKWIINAVKIAWHELTRKVSEQEMVDEERYQEWRRSRGEWL